MAYDPERPNAGGAGEYGSDPNRRIEVSPETLLELEGVLEALEPLARKRHTRAVELHLPADGVTVDIHCQEETVTAGGYEVRNLHLSIQSNSLAGNEFFLARDVAVGDVEMLTGQDDFVAMSRIAVVVDRQEEATQQWVWGAYTALSFGDESLEVEVPNLLRDAPPKELFDSTTYTLDKTPFPNGTYITAEWRKYNGESELFSYAPLRFITIETYDGVLYEYALLSSGEAVLGRDIAGMSLSEVQISGENLVEEFVGVLHDALQGNQRAA